MISAIRPRPLSSLPPLWVPGAAGSKESCKDNLGALRSSLPPMPVNAGVLAFPRDPRSGVSTKVDPRPFAESRGS